jgi:hypothetical protein
LFSAFLGWGGYHVADGFVKFKGTPGVDHAPPIAYAIGFAVAGAVLFFLFLCVTGAPVNNLDKYYIAGTSVLSLGFGVPLLAPILGGVIVLVCLAASLFLSWLRVQLNSLGAGAREIVDNAAEMRAAMLQVRAEQARIRALEHQPDLGDLGDRVNS